MKDLKVSMNCEIELGSDPAKNGAMIQEAITKGFKIIYAAADIVNLQYVNGHIFGGDSEALVGAAAPILPVSKPAKLSESKGLIQMASCERCKDGKVRSDGRACPGCDKRICTECKNYSAGGKCHDCAPRKPVASYKKSIGIPPQKKSHTEVLAAVACESCKRGKREKTCFVCSKFVCLGCWNDANQSCSKCAAVE